MVSLELKDLVEETNGTLDEKVSKQVAEIMEAAAIEEEQTQDFRPLAKTWKYSMPFAGVRYFSYD